MKIFILLFLVVFNGLIAQEKITLGWLSPVEDNYETALFKKIINLYNLKEKMQIEVIFKPFTKWDDIVKQCKENKNNNSILYMANITILEDRATWADFSEPYFFTYVSLLTHKANTKIDTNYYMKASSKIGYLSVTTGEKIGKKYAQEFKYNLIKFATTGAKNAMPNNGVDYVFGDHIEILGQTNLIVVKDFKEQKDAFGIMYPKGSNLKTKFDSYIKYYVKSADNYNLLKKYLGANIADYYKNKL